MLWAMQVLEVFCGCMWPVEIGHYYSVLYVSDSHVYFEYKAMRVMIVNFCGKELQQSYHALQALELKVVVCKVTGVKIRQCYQFSIK